MIKIIKLSQIIIALLLLLTCVYIHISAKYEYFDLMNNNQTVHEIFGELSIVRLIGASVYKNPDGKAIESKLYLLGENGRGFAKTRILKLNDKPPIIQGIYIQTSFNQYKQAQPQTDEIFNGFQLNKSIYIFEVIWRLVVLLLISITFFLMKRHSDLILKILLLKTKFTPKFVQKFFDGYFVSMVLVLCGIIMLHNLIKLL